MAKLPWRNWRRLNERLVGPVICDVMPDAAFMVQKLVSGPLDAKVRIELQADAIFRPTNPQADSPPDPGTYAVHHSQLTRQPRPGPALRRGPGRRRTRAAPPQCGIVILRENPVPIEQGQRRRSLRAKHPLIHLADGAPVARHGLAEFIRAGKAAPDRDSIERGWIDR